MSKFKNNTQLSIVHRPSLFPLLLSPLSLLIILSCSPQQRLERLVYRHPELRTVDTLRFTDTVITPMARIDTALSLFNLAHPSVIRHDRLELSVLRIRDTVHIRAACNPDTIIRTHTVAVEKIRVVRSPPGSSLFDKILVVVGMVIAGLMMYRVMGKE